MNPRNANWTTLQAPRLATATRRPARGTFIERPHRFAARVALRDGTCVDAHVPNPGRLTGVIAPGCEVALDGPYPPPRALTHTVVAARPSRVWIGTNTLYANRVFPALRAAGLFPELGDGAAAAEVKHGHSRFDFQIGRRFVEVKSVTLAEGRSGLFPDAVTARGARHCDELAALARKGTACAIVFVAQRGDVDSIAPEDTVDPVFGRAIRAAARAGVLVLACALDLIPEGARAARRIPVILK
ncbi:MAG: DNA/RNA nuclease SfsA [Acidobacteria bacterium]|nr:DNA/RNA nuclease SfsA [Acidobacteriota bacterium]